MTSERCQSPRGHEASTGASPSYPSFLRRNPPKHPLSLFELRWVPEHEIGQKKKVL